MTSDKKGGIQEKQTEMKWFKMSSKETENQSMFDNMRIINILNTLINRTISVIKTLTVHGKSKHNHRIFTEKVSCRRH
ncbi:hypothetical protein BABINDRAFT_151559 [Babjeviella inositovora NRRL Y-12698]|uniref:Uncharacterized protein n=1 Tax=Babjeviella inositovora NRRL Y-12698 TaxID=984486 RepID=A0A1E3QNH0_9ASCO|nr:uncharacterized protein BABINDRAFT_151559 [Babjeviella inositovora NRRL Y-12698]ODQ78642.1 hypothetical protein BABINDRAFT_151559 [Babjeviella inositovora NRRL Y-12698]